MWTSVSVIGAKALAAARRSRIWSLPRTSSRYFGRTTRAAVDREEEKKHCAFWNSTRALQREERWWLEVFLALFNLESSVSSG